MGMFGDFLKRLTQPDPEPLVDEDARLALAALLVRVARADGHYSADEAEQIVDILAKRYGLAATASKALREQAEVLEAEAPDTVRFTRAIKDAVPHEDRESVIEALWTIVLSDGQRDAKENATLRLVANLLGVNDRDSNIARQRVDRG